MTSVYESLRALLRQKELEIKKLEKEIEALRIVLPIVAEAGLSPVEGQPPVAGARPNPEPNKTKTFAMPPKGPEFENLVAQAAAAAAVPAGTPTIPPPDLTPKPRTNWP